MDKYLLEILKSVNTIIIPGLGALTITNHETGEIMFMPYLKHDDGKLAEYITEKEGFEELEAKNLIAKYVREIQLTLSKGESYDMYQFGSFIKNGDEIDFENWKQPTLEIKKDETEQASAVVTEEKTIDITKNPTEEASEIISSNDGDTKEQNDKTIVVHLKEEEKKEPLVKVEKKEDNILEKEEKAAVVAKLEKLEKLKEDKNKPKKKKKKGAAFWMLMTLIVLILSGGTYFGLNYDSLKQHVPFLADKETSIKDNETIENTEIENLDTEINSSNTESNAAEELPQEDEAELETSQEENEPAEEVEVIEKEKVSEPIQTNQTPNVGSDLPFHVIAGAFSSENNANRFGEKLRSEGYTVKVGPGRGMHLVSIKSFKTRSEAQNELSNLSSVAPQAWVYEWR